MIHLISTALKVVFLSSANQGQVSSTLKSLSIIIVPVIMWYYGLDQDTAGQVFADFLTIISMLLSSVFILRKIYLTLSGRNVNL